VSPCAGITPLEPWTAAKIGREGRPLSREALEEYQLTKLNETLSLVQEASSFYRGSLGAEKIHVSSLDELADLPLTSPDQLRAQPFDFLCVRQGDVERIVTLPTSGTTGPPKRIFFTSEDQELTRDFFHVGMSTLVQAGDRVLILLPGSLPGSVGRLLKEGLERMDVAGIPHGPVTDPGRTLEVMERETVTAVVGIPVQVLALARCTSAERGGSRLRLKSALLSTDQVSRAVVSAIEAAWGCDVFNHYGTTEMGLGGGVDCAARAGYHLREADLLFEIVDPVSGRPTPDGEIGEVVFTTLTRAAMPLIRYRTGDSSCFLPAPCACGTVLKRLAHIDRRLAGAAVFPGGHTLYVKDFDEALFPLEGLTDFRLVLAEKAQGATLVVYVKRCGGAAAPSPDQVVQGLLGVPAVSREVASGGLTLDIRDWDPGAGAETGTSKRNITHLQGAIR